MSELKHFGNSFGGPGKDVCEFCGNESSTHNWVNGVCKSCQDKTRIPEGGLKITKPFLIILTLCIFPLAIVEIVLNLVTFGFYNKIIGRQLVVRLGEYVATKEME